MWKSVAALSLDGAAAAAQGDRVTVNKQTPLHSPTAVVARRDTAPTGRNEQLNFLLIRLCFINVYTYPNPKAPFTPSTITIKITITITIFASTPRRV